jgi:replicative DNA helicase
MTIDAPIQSQRLATAQAAVLGAMLIDSDCIADVLADTSEAMFVSSVYRTVYGCIRQLFQEAQPVDPVTVGAALKERSGQDYGELLVQLMDVTPTSANVGSYVEILKRESIVWRLRSIGAALAETEDLPAAEKLMEKANAAMSLKSGVEVWDMTQMWENFCQRHAQTAKTEYIRWGYDFIDERVYTARGDYCVIGGYSSAGKTCLALCMAMKMAQQYRVGFFSYETDKEKLTDRIMSAKAMVGLSDIKQNKLGEKEWEELAYAASSLSRTGLQIMQCSGFTVADIQSVALSRHYDVVFVDYLQLVEADGRKGWGRPEEVGSISRGLQRMSHEHGITAVVLSQLTPDDRRKKNEAPTMYDLRESRQIAMDADVIFLLYLEDPADRAGPRILKCDKNKDGQAGWYKVMQFQGRIQSFRPMPKPVAKAAPLPAQVSFHEIKDDGDAPF